MRQLLALSWLAAASLGCSPHGVVSAGRDRPGAEALASVASGQKGQACPAFSQTSGALPRVTPAELTLAYWFQQLGKRYDLDEVLLDAKGIATLNASAAVPREDYHS